MVSSTSIFSSVPVFRNTEAIGDRSDKEDNNQVSLPMPHRFVTSREWLPIFPVEDEPVVALVPSALSGLQEVKAQSVPIAHRLIS